MFAFNETQQDMRKLLLELKTYFGLQKRLFAITAIEKTVAILSVIAIAAITLILGSIVLLFASFALAYWIGQSTGNLAIGFASIALAVAIVLYLTYHNRRKWIILPLARKIASILSDANQEHNSQI